MVNLESQKRERRKLRVVAEPLCDAVLVCLMDVFDTGGDRTQKK